MKGEHWIRVREIFLAAVELPLEERDAYVERACGDDADLMLEVRRLLGSAAKKGFLEPPSAEDVAGPLGELTRASAGRELGGYRLEQEIGHGGMGVVYAAREIVTGRRVALKVLSPHLHLSPQAVERFQREARAAARLDHPGIVSVLDFGNEAGSYFFAMELVEGPALSDLVVERRMPHSEQALRCRTQCSTLGLEIDLSDPRHCAELAAHVAEALEHAHRHGVIHRDVKPQNVLLDASGQPRLVDFGLARDAEASSLTRTGEVAGTPHYMSPEQALSRIHEIDHRTDIYSLGAVLYELLTLRRPFEGATQQEIFYKITHSSPVPIESLNPRVPRPLVLVCMKALRREPERRYATAADFAADLRRFLAGTEVLARPPSLAYLAGQLVRHPRNLAMALPVVLALGLSGGWLWRQHRIDAAELAARPVLVVEPLQGAAGVEVRLRPRVERPQGWGEASPVGRVEREALELRLDPGAWMIVVDAGDGRFAELSRDLDRDSRTDLADIRLASVDEVRQGMVLVRATRLETQLSLDPSVRGVVEVAPFWIDLACVTNGEYADFLAATGAPAPQLHWPEDPSSGSADLPRPDWRELPVTDLSYAESRAFAEWAGKRLPTAWELLVAFGADDPAWLESVLALAPSPLVLGGEQLLPTDDGDESVWLAYLAHVHPAGGPTAVPMGPYGLFHPVGNVKQISDTPGWEAQISPPILQPRSRLQVGYPWHYKPFVVRRYGLNVSGQVELHNRTRDQGLRCCKSVAP